MLPHSLCCRRRFCNLIFVSQACPCVAEAAELYATPHITFLSLLHHLQDPLLHPDACSSCLAAAAAAVAAGRGGCQVYS
jgi:hypothetical protein